MTEMFYMGSNISEKHNGIIFETYEASLVVLSIASVKLHFSKSPVVAKFLINFAQKVISVTAQSLKTVG